MTSQWARLHPPSARGRGQGGKRGGSKGRAWKVQSSPNQPSRKRQRRRRSHPAGMRGPMNQPLTKRMEVITVNTKNNLPNVTCVAIYINMWFTFKDICILMALKVNHRILCKSTKAFFVIFLIGIGSNMVTKIQKKAFQIIIPLGWCFL